MFLEEADFDESGESPALKSKQSASPPRFDRSGTSGGMAMLDLDGSNDSDFAPVRGGNTPSSSRARMLAQQRDIQLKKRQTILESGGMVRSSLDRDAAEANRKSQDAQFTPAVRQFSAPKAVKESSSDYKQEETEFDRPAGVAKAQRFNQQEQDQHPHQQQQQQQQQRRDDRRDDRDDRGDDRGSRYDDDDRYDSRDRDRDRDRNKRGGGGGGGWDRWDDRKDRDRDSGRNRDAGRDGRDRDRDRDRRDRDHRDRDRDSRHRGGGRGRGRSKYDDEYDDDDESPRRSDEELEEEEEKPRRQKNKTTTKKATRKASKSPIRAAEAKPEVKLEPLNLKDIRKFLTTPVPKGAGVVKCCIRRNKGGMNKLFPMYSLYLTDGDLFLLASRKRPNNRLSNYLITASENDLSREGSGFLGKLRKKNMIGTEFVTYDDGTSPEDGGRGSSARKELCAVTYAPNMMGSRGPRKMQVAVPGVDPVSNEPLVDGDMDLLQCIKDRKFTDCTYMINKPPLWNENVGAYVLNFYGRVTMASVKNFQLVDPEDQSTVLLQFGRTDKDSFNMDLRWPLSPMQAFAITLSSFDSKMGCD